MIIIFFLKKKNLKWSSVSFFPFLGGMGRDWGQQAEKRKACFCPKDHEAPKQPFFLILAFCVYTGIRQMHVELCCHCRRLLAKASGQDLTEITTPIILKTTALLFSQIKLFLPPPPPLGHAIALRLTYHTIMLCSALGGFKTVLQCLPIAPNNLDPQFYPPLKGGRKA